MYTLEDGAHYLNINLRTPEGISLARTAGLGQAGVADVILTQYIFNAADLFRDTGKYVALMRQCNLLLLTMVSYICVDYVFPTIRSHRKMFYSNKTSY